MEKSLLYHFFLYTEHCYNITYYSSSTLNNQQYIINNVSQYNYIMSLIPVRWDEQCKRTTTAGNIITISIFKNNSQLFSTLAFSPKCSGGQKPFQSQFKAFRPRLLGQKLWFCIVTVASIVHYLNARWRWCILQSYLSADHL